MAPGMRFFNSACPVYCCARDPVFFPREQLAPGAISDNNSVPPAGADYAVRLADRLRWRGNLRRSQSRWTKDRTSSSIMADDHAYQAISAYGSTLIETPNIDRLAGEGARFDHAFVGNSICSPSRATLLTGKFSHANGLRNNIHVFDGSQPTLQALMRGAGYQTAIVGKWHLKSEPTGFDHWEVLPDQGEYYNPDFRSAAGMRRYTGYVTDIITDLALTWLDKDRDRSKPFLLFYHHKAPHREWWPSLDNLEAYHGAPIPEPRDAVRRLRRPRYGGARCGDAHQRSHGSVQRQQDHTRECRSAWSRQFHELVRRCVSPAV